MPGYSTIARIIGSHALSTEEREKDDFYATDPIAAEWLIKIEHLDHNIWECACGMGHLSRVFEEHGFNVRSTDLIARGYGDGGIDFLQQTDPWDGDIITNPPYKYAQDFIVKGLSLIPDGKKLCLFMKLQFLEGSKRKELFREYPPKTVWVSSSRIQHGKNGVFGGSSMLATAWFVWEKGYSGETVVRWFN